MKQFSVSHKWALIFSVIITVPILFVISISLLKYGFGVNRPFDTAQPLLEKWGIKESIGFNINAVILFGPILAIILNALSLVQYKLKLTGEYYELLISVKRYWWNIILAAVAGICLAALFIYLLGENCR